MADAQVSIDLFGLLDLSDQHQIMGVYSDGYFDRKAGNIDVGSGAEVSYLIDYIHELKMGVVYLSVNLTGTETVELCANGSGYKTGSWGTVMHDDRTETALWVPERVLARGDLQNGHIRDEEKVDSRYDECRFRFRPSSCRNMTVEVPVLFTKHKVQEFVSQITCLRPYEAQSIKRNSLFEYTNISDVWNHLISGIVYSNRIYSYDLKCHLRFPCQQAANILFSHLTHLSAMSGKIIYRFLSDLVAYSVMLSLPDDSRWRHGIWSVEAMETHFRFQVSGISLLASYYEQTKRQVFLDKARNAMDYIVSMADRFPDDTLWFLHDSLEQSESWNQCRYKNDIQSDAFGKSKYNTLCLNTHIWAILGLCQLKELSKDASYDITIEQGLNALKKVLTAKPAGWLYRPLYWFRDIIIRRSARNTAGRFTRKAKKHYENLLTKSILPLLKRKYPRLSMPTGFIERDLTHSCLSDGYHLFTLDDLLILYAHRPSEWLKDTITHSIDYTHNTGFVKCYALKNVTANLFLEILLLYSALIDDAYLRLLPAYMAFFKEHDIIITTDVSSNRLVCSREIGVSVDNGLLKVLTVNYAENIMAVIVNHQGQTQKTKIDLHFLSDLCETDVMITDSHGSEISSLLDVEIPSLDFVKVVRR